jgi:hypothetical protein
MIDVPDPPFRYEPPDAPSPYCKNCGYLINSEPGCPNCGYTRVDAATEADLYRNLQVLADERRRLVDDYHRDVLDRYDKDF